jgi:hypothetical protein
MNEKPALESLRVRTQPLTVICAPIAVSPDRAFFILMNDMTLWLIFARETPNNNAPSSARTPLSIALKDLLIGLGVKNRLEYGNHVNQIRDGAGPDVP